MQNNTGVVVVVVLCYRKAGDGRMPTADGQLNCSAAGNGNFNFKLYFVAVTHIFLDQKS